MAGGEPDRRTARPHAHRDDWWADVDHELLGCFDADGPVSIDALAYRLGIPERAASSLVAMLACEGKVHIRLVERGKEATTMEQDRMPERGARLATETAGAGVEAIAAGAEAGQRALSEATNVSALMMREGWGVLMEMQHAVLNAAREQQAALIRWQTLWAEMLVDPLRGYQRALEESVEATRRVLALAGANARAIGEAVDRVQTSARQTVRRAA
jgi:hypothetical protein